MLLALCKLAVRNVLRNRRRSGLTLASVIIGVAALFFIQSLIKSLQADMVDRAIGVFNAHLQVQSKASDDPKIPEASFGGVAEIDAALKADPEITAVSKRILFTGLVASAVNSMGVGVFSIDPQDESKLSTISSYVRDGRFLEAGREIIVGSKIAKNLDVRIGEKVVIMAQSREGAFEGRALRVVGIFETGSYTWDASMVYMMRQDAQDLLAWGDEVNTIAVKIKDASKLHAVQQRLAGALGASQKGLKVLSWKDVSAEIIHIQGFQDSVLLLVLTVVFAIVALGILNTMLMSLFERIREFGLMMALGAKRRDVAVLLLTESAYLGVVGMSWGAAWGMSIIIFFHFVGLPLPLGEALSYFLPFEKTLFLRFAWSSHLLAIVCVVLVSCVAGIVPALRVRRLRAAEALRHV
ncbi:MAG: ABC transporter permease [Elusimicrobia bacterium]|nr:ABC transporter permease [Elusimicrobiota bacterium]